MNQTSRFAIQGIRVNRLTGESWVKYGNATRYSKVHELNGRLFIIHGADRIRRYLDPDSTEQINAQMKGNFK